MLLNHFNVREAEQFCFQMAIVFPRIGLFPAHSISLQPGPPLFSILLFLDPVFLYSNKSMLLPLHLYCRLSQCLRVAFVYLFLFSASLSLLIFFWILNKFIWSWKSMNRNVINQVGREMRYWKVWISEELFSPVAGFKGIFVGLGKPHLEWLPTALLGLLTQAKLLGILAGQHPISVQKAFCWNIYGIN